MNQDSHRRAALVSGDDFRVVGVIDVRHGRVVHARGGVRDRYAPVASVLGSVDEPLDLARRYREILGLGNVYLADLDAIERGASAPSTTRALAELGLEVWVDVGLRDAAAIPDGLAVQNVAPIAASESLAGPSALAALGSALGLERLVFGLDLRGGRALVGPRSDWRDDRPHGLLASAMGMGLRRFVILDLERVGSGKGLGTLELASWTRRRIPEAEILVGGGATGLSDMIQARDAGASGILVASALHDGRIGRREIATIRHP